jgi:hypothetical protein
MPAQYACVLHSAAHSLDTTLALYAGLASIATQCRGWLLQCMRAKPQLTACVAGADHWTIRVCQG